MSGAKVYALAERRDGEPAQAARELRTRAEQLVDGTVVGVIVGVAHADGSISFSAHIGAGGSTLRMLPVADYAAHRLRALAFRDDD